jgi:predicted hotdog family 3-hydroxylacyl-ACP dehydratase
MTVNAENITSLIPQRAPFVMIDNLLHDDEVRTNTNFTIRAENIFMSGKYLSAAALVENIAQTAAAGAGYKAISQDSPVLVGFIGAIKNLEIGELPEVGDVLETETKLVNTVFNVSIVEGVVTCNGRKLASCEMKIFLQPKP